MGISKRLIPLLLITTLMSLAAACVESKHPLSDEKTSKIDERLIGTWQGDPKMICRAKKSVVTKNALDVDVRDENGTAHLLLCFAIDIQGQAIH